MLTPPCHDCARIASDLFRAGRRAANLAGTDEEGDGNRVAVESARLGLAQALRARTSHETETGHTVPRLPA